MLFAALNRGFDNLDVLRHLPADLSFNDLLQSDIGGAKVGVLHQGPAQPAGTGCELPNAAGNKIYQYVGIADFR